MELYINKQLYLTSYRTEGRVPELCNSGIDDTECELSQDDAKKIIEFMIEHFKGRSLTDDEANAIARII